MRRWRTKLRRAWRSWTWRHRWKTKMASLNRSRSRRPERRGRIPRRGRSDERRQLCSQVRPVCSLRAAVLVIYVCVKDDHDEEEAGGLRRGKRTRYAPLEWWRCEKIVYGRRESGVSFVPTIKAIVRIPKEPPKPLGVHARKRWRKAKS